VKKSVCPVQIQKGGKSGSSAVSGQRCPQGSEFGGHWGGQHQRQEERTPNSLRTTRRKIRNPALVILGGIFDGAHRLIKAPKKPKLLEKGNPSVRRQALYGPGGGLKSETCPSCHGGGTALWVCKGIFQKPGKPKGGWGTRENNTLTPLKGTGRRKNILRMTKRKKKKRPARAGGFQIPPKKKDEKNVEFLPLDLGSREQGKDFQKVRASSVKGEKEYRIRSTYSATACRKNILPQIGNLFGPGGALSPPQKPWFRSRTPPPPPPPRDKRAGKKKKFMKAFEGGKKKPHSASNKGGVPFS